MPEKFNSQTPTIDQGIVKFKQLATRISLSLGLAVGGVGAIAEQVNPVVVTDKPVIQIARNELSNQQKEAFDSIYKKALKLSNHLQIPVNLMTSDDRTYFAFRDSYQPNPQTQVQIAVCGNKDAKVELANYKQNQVGLIKYALRHCVLQLPIDFFTQSGDPIDNLQKDYPEVYKEIKEKITQFQFTNDDYYQLVTKLTDIVDGNKDKNRKNIRIYVSEEMSYQVETRTRNMMNEMNVPQLRSHNIEFTSAEGVNQIIKHNPNTPFIRGKGQNDTIIINLPLMMNK